MIDMWRLNALLAHLMAAQETFDPEAARELYEALPEEGVPSIRVRWSSPSASHSPNLLTNLGLFSFKEKTVKSGEFGSKGLFIGNWRVTERKGRVKIEPRFAGLDCDDVYELEFGREDVKFLKSNPKFYSIPLFLGSLRLSLTCG